QDAFSIHYNFVNFHEFDDMDYRLKLVMDDGVTVFVSQLGNDYEVFEEKLNELLGGMYEVIVNDVLKEAFVQFHAATLLKLAYKMRGGKSVPFHDIKKIDAELAAEVESFIYEDDGLQEKLKLLRDMVDDYNIYYGIARDITVNAGYIKWIMFAIPEKNIVAFTILPRWEVGKQSENDTYFYKIIMEKGRPADKVEDKIQEIDQALVNLHFIKDPCYKDKRDLRHSPYQYAIRKLPYLRILRKSFCGRAAAIDVKEWQKQALEVMKNAELK
ncbi:hypothetical protein HY605_02360, partial [Candidatus Peregrinibacteria bacterium]|nr:hypothetical protein [Candidatus Peregrinibacteria bacterium]